MKIIHVKKDMKKTEIKYFENQPLHGLFHRYRKSLDSLFNFSFSSLYPNREPKYTLIEEQGGNWISMPYENSSFSIQFLRFPFKISSYSLRSRTDFGWNLPCEWMLEGSNNNNTWNLLHYHERNNDLNGTNIVKNWKTSFKCEGYYHFFKVTQLGINIQTSNDLDHPNNSFVFTMNKVEFFGEILSASTTCRTKIRKQKYLIFIYLFETVY